MKLFINTTIAKKAVVSLLDKKGEVLARIGQKEEAITLLRKALKLARKNNDKLIMMRIQKQLRVLKK